MLHTNVVLPLVLLSDIVGEEGMLEALLSGRALVRVPLKHLQDEVDGIIASIWYDRL